MMTASAYECNYVFNIFAELYLNSGSSNNFLQDGFKCLETKI